MKLEDLDPRWTGLNTIVPNQLRLGLTFLCPHCRAERLGLQFQPAIDPDHIISSISSPWQMDRHIWEREGDTFETLTLKPSVDASGVGHWHGHITNGEIVGGI